MYDELIYFIFPDPPTSTQTYAGDYEDVDDHIERTKQGAKELDICSGIFDTIRHIRHELMVFLEDKMWRFTGRGNPRPGYPGPASQMFPFLKGMKKIDAVYERPDGYILFFSADTYLVSDGNSLIGECYCGMIIIEYHLQVRFQDP